MGIYEDVSEQMKEAMKARDKERLTALRNIRAALLTGAKETGAERLDDEKSVEILRRLAKQRAESVEEYDKHGRHEVAAQERAELGVIESFLPRLAGEDTVRDWVQQAIAETGASSPRDLGKVMGALMRSHKGEFDGKVANRIVRELLPG